MLNPGEAYPQFLHQIKALDTQVPANEFESILRELNDQHYSDEDALDLMVRWYSEPPPHTLSIRSLAASYSRPRLWVEMLRREIQKR
jgi:hypothetical protein